MSDHQTDIDSTEGETDAEGHAFIPAAAREREIDDAEGHAINFRPLDKGPQS